MFWGDILISILGFIVRSWGTFFLLDEFMISRKKGLKKNRSFLSSTFIKYFIGAWIIILLSVTGRSDTSKIPIIINHDYQITSGQVKKVGEIVEDENQYRYNDLEIIVDGEVRTEDEIYGPEIKGNDKLKFYDISNDVACQIVTEINGENVIDDYEFKIAKRGDSTLFLKTVILIYLFFFCFVHAYLILTKRRKYKEQIQKRNYFIYGYNIEKAGYLLWIAGIICFTVVGITAIIGVGNNYWLGIAMESFCYLYNLGYCMVFIGQIRSVEYVQNSICINETCGYIRRYAIEDISYISEIKPNKYRFVFNDKFSQYIGVHNEFQKIVLKELAGGRFEKDIYYDEL